MVNHTQNRLAHRAASIVFSPPHTYLYLYSPGPKPDTPGWSSYKMPLATPTPSRNSRYASTTTNDNGNDDGIPNLDQQLPPYEPPLAPLTQKSQTALADLAQSHKLKALQTHITHAVEKLGDSAAQVNERLTDARERYTRYTARKRSRSQYENENNGGEDQREGEGEDEKDEEFQRFKRTEEQVHAITEKLESEMRGIVDTEVKAGGLISILADLGKEAEAASTATQRQQPRNTRRRRRNSNPDSDEEAENEDEEDEDYQETQQSQRASEPPSQKLTTQLTTETQNWHALSLTQRYSTNNTYIGFYRMVHDAKHPGDDIPPLPHASTWFRHLEDPSTAAVPPRTQTRPQTRRHQSTPAEGNDEDIAIEKERVSLKCPLTLLTFNEPLTSTKCPHSFEAQAIMDMISHSPMMVPVGRDRRNRVRAVKCPVCSVVLTQEDLKRDAVLERRVRRMQRQQQEEEEEEDEDEDEDEDGGDGRRRKRNRAQRKSGITVASDDEDDDDDEEEAQPVRVKQEKAMTRGPSAI